MLLPLFIYRPIEIPPLWYCGRSAILIAHLTVSGINYTRNFGRTGLLMQISEAMDLSYHVDPQNGSILCTQWKNFREKLPVIQETRINLTVLVELINSKKNLRAKNHPCDANNTVKWLQGVLYCGIFYIWYRWRNTAVWFKKDSHVAQLLFIPSARHRTAHFRWQSTWCLCYRCLSVNWVWVFSHSFISHAVLFLSNFKSPFLRKKFISDTFFLFSSTSVIASFPIAVTEVEVKVGVLTDNAFIVI